MSDNDNDHTHASPAAQRAGEKPVTVAIGASAGGMALSEAALQIEAISRARSDLQNLVAATDVGTLFLDSGLRIKLFTDRVTDLFSITQTDEGRPITDFAHQLEYEDLVKDVRGVLADLTPVRREVHSRTGGWYDVRLRPYRTVDNNIDGVVVTFVDVSERHNVEAMLRQERRLVELSRSPIFIWEVGVGVVEWNRGAEELYGFSRAEALGKRKDVLLAMEVPGSSFADLQDALLRDGSWEGELHHTTKDGRKLLVESRMVLETLNGRRLALESNRDITEQGRWENSQQLLLNELTHRVKNTLAVVQAIAHQTGYYSRSTKDFVEQLDERLVALSRAHDLLITSDWQGADLATLARDQIISHVPDGSDRLHIAGDRVSLPVGIATPFGLVFHELATNAAKYGSLSTSIGVVNLTWTVEPRDEGRSLTLVWREEGGPKVKRSERAGSGRKLIERAIPGATVSREFRNDGFVCTIRCALPAINRLAG